MARSDHLNFRTFLPYLAVSLGVVGVLVFTSQSQRKQEYENAQASAYNPKLNPSEFTTNITNKYTSLPVGRKLVSQEETSEGLERVEITIPGTKKTLKYNGQDYATLVYRDKVWLDANGDGKFVNRELIEDTKDYLAQNKATGDLWYFGEDVNNYENGVLIDHDGSWLAGVAGAKPGIWVKQNPVVGETYLQEYYNNVAEDTVDVLSITETVTTKFGTFKNCLKTYDYTPLDPESKEYKYYCTQTTDGRKVNARVLVVNVNTGERSELIQVTNTGAGDDD